MAGAQWAPVYGQGERNPWNEITDWQESPTGHIRIRDIGLELACK